MNIQQFRYVTEVAKRNLNVSSRGGPAHVAAWRPPSRSARIEDELGVSIFVRQGKRFTAITDAGRNRDSHRPESLPRWGT
jgi:LysR family cys regulon transcriptional activator